MLTVLISEPSLKLSEESVPFILIAAHVTSRVAKIWAPLGLPAIRNAFPDNLRVCAGSFTVLISVHGYCDMIRVVARPKGVVSIASR